MSLQFKMTIPDALQERIGDLPGTHQEICLRGLHLLVYGSPVEQELRAEVERLHETIRRLGTIPPPPPPRLASEKELGW